MIRRLVTLAIPAVLVAMAAAASGDPDAASPVDPLSPRPGPSEEVCGFPHVCETASASGTTLLARPAPGPNTVGSTHFIVHYSGAGLASYAQDVSDAAELAYKVLIDTLAHLTPPSDGTLGGDARTDIYLRTPAEMDGPVYGLTFFENLVGTPYGNSYTSWVELVDTLTAPRRRQVTAHEFYHVIQIGYDRYESVSLLEMFSTWVERRVFPQYNPNLPTLQLFFRTPWRGLFNQTYTNSPWAIFLTERHGDAIMPATLAYCGATTGPNPREAFDGAISDLTGSTFYDEFLEFGTFNFFVGSRDDGAHYKEGAIYHDLSLELHSDCYPFLTHVTQHTLGELGANYFFFDGDGHSDALKLRVIPDYLASSMLTVTRFKGAARTRNTIYYNPLSPEDSLLIDDWGQCDSLLVVYQIDHGSGANGIGIAARYQPPPVPAGDWILVLDRDGCRRPFEGVADEFHVRTGEEAPIAEELRSLGANVVVSDTLLSSFGGCVGVFVVGGFDDSGVTLPDVVLTALTQFIDAGGDIYVEGSRLGELLAAGDAAQQVFWGRFGCDFTPGSDSGNVASWNTTGSGAVGDYSFTYDPGAPDTRVGSLLPGAAQTLIEDGTGGVRATEWTVGLSTRVMCTVLLGGSTGTGGSTRAAYLNDLTTLFGVQLAALSVVRANVSVAGYDVTIAGVIENYDGETLVLRRADARGSADVPLDLRRAGGEWRFGARDRLSGAEAVYKLVDETHGRVLWEEQARAAAPAYALGLSGVYPNPARDSVRLVIEAAEAARASIGVYDVAGRRVALASTSLVPGSNVFFMRPPAGSGQYFVRVEAGRARTSGRFTVIR